MSYLALVAVLLTGLPIVSSSIIPSAKASSSPSSQCRYLSKDAGWPNDTIWDQLNRTVEGRLIRGVPLGQPCHSPYLNSEKCSQIQSEWTLLPPFVADPVNVMSLYWTNNSCSAFTGSDGVCSSGNLAQYALNINGPTDVITGIQFAQGHNIRLTIKNTGHDFLGRSAGASSLALWTHNLKNITFLNYSSTAYSGPAVRIGAGVEYDDLYPVASARGLRVVGGSCPTVGVVGGFTQGGGHGPLGSIYGLAADQVLEWEVVTAAGNHLTVSPTSNAQLFWALSGGGAGNYGVVLSATVRAYPDGPVAGAGFSFTNTGNDTTYWQGVTAWLRHLVVLSNINGIVTVWSLTARSFELEFATWPDVNSSSQIDNALAPFINKLAQLNISLGTSYTSNIHPNFAQHYKYWATQTYDSNITLGGRLIPRSVVQDENVGLPALISNFRNITGGGAKIISVAANFTHSTHVSNSVLPAWRDALFTTSFARSLPVNSGWDQIRQDQAQLNAWQEALRTTTPGAGTYMNEATWDNPHWKEDYFGPNYQTLLGIKEKYDPTYVFWANAAVGSDTYWTVSADERLCRVG
ncbi:FAD/FMN-containing isoamyl alcohol oxidase-like protein MreA [Xylaria cf. heliscus]|nr:FAD/FMN-containing isoamyl alcohol oxidase-like protein MreA [Xylaria cf. heliscus]